MKLYDSAAIDYTIPPGCPWYQAQQSYGTPNVDWCEPTICAYINEPANTWSNIGFLLVGFLLIRFFKEKVVQRFAIIVILMGTFSAIYHASNNYLSQHLDFLGMSLFASYMLTFAFLRATQKSQSLFYTYYWFFVSLNMMTLIVLGIIKLPIQMLLMINTIPIILIELYIAFYLKKRKGIIYLIISLITLIAAQVSAQIDLKRIYCVESNWLLHGHVIWHVLCAVSMGFIGLHIFHRKHELSKK